MLSIESVLMVVLGGIMAFLWWTVRKYILKVDDLETRVTKLETVMYMLGDIRSDIGQVKTDVEVIKARML